MKMFLKVIVGIVALVAAFSASASTYYLTNGSGVTPSINSGDASPLVVGDWGYNQYFIAGTGTSFTDTFNFTVATPVTGAASANNLPLTIKLNNSTSLNLNNFSSFTASFWDGSSLNPLTYVTDSSGSYFQGSGPLNPGTDYYVQVSGVTSGTQGGLYQFSYAMTSPVPVPAAVWLFGSGLLGLMAIARRKSV